MVYLLKKNFKLSLVFIFLLVPLTLFAIFPAGYIKHVAPRLGVLAAQQSAVMLQDYYFSKGFRYNCDNTEYYGVKGGLSVIVPVFLPEKKNLLLIEPNVEAWFIYVPDVINQSTTEFVEEIAAYNTNYYEECGV